MQLDTRGRNDIPLVPVTMAALGLARRLGEQNGNKLSLRR